MLNTNSLGNTSLSSLLAVTVSVIAALFILVVFILPAEFGKDLTGLGAKFGVNNMSKEEVSEANSSTTNTATIYNGLLANVHNTSSDPDKIESVEHTLFNTPVKFMQTVVILEANNHAEFKFDLLTGYHVNYTWSVEDNSLVYSDLHGHNPGPSGTEEDEELVNYLDSQQDMALSGHFIAPFDGDHGWYFLNLENKEVRINIQASGHWNGYEFLPLENDY